MLAAVKALTPKPTGITTATCLACFVCLIAGDSEIIIHTKAASRSNDLCLVHADQGRMDGKRLTDKRVEMMGGDSGQGWGDGITGEATWSGGG